MSETMKEEIHRLEEENGRLNWRLEHARSQYHLFLEASLPYLDEESKREIFIKLGRNCAKVMGVAQSYIGNPQGFFQYMKGHSGETITMTEDGKTILVETMERSCDCPIMNGRCIEGSYCNCSIGWQMETYETIMEQKVTVAIEKAAFRGDKKCVFLVHLIGA